MAADRRKSSNQPALTRMLQLQSKKKDNPQLRVNSISSLDKEGMVKAIIETPKRSRNKYKFDPECGLFECESTLQGGLLYPFDFGFIPSTLAEDGDPLDVIVLMDEPSFPGCFVHARIIGVLEAEQTEKGKTVRNDRLIAVHHKSVDYGEYTLWKELPSNVRLEIETFFILKNRTSGREFTPLGWKGPRRAYQLLAKAVTFKKKQESA